MKTFVVKRTAGTTLTELKTAIKNGGSFVTYCYCISIVALTFKPSSPPYFIRPGEHASKYRIKYTIYSLFFGWWGLPWGPIHTIDRIRINMKSGGGINITEEVMAKIEEEYGNQESDKPFEQDISITYGKAEVITENSRVGRVS